MYSWYPLPPHKQILRTPSTRVDDSHAHGNLLETGPQILPGIRQVQVVAAYLAPERDVVLRHVPAVVPEQRVHRVALEPVIGPGPRYPVVVGSCASVPAVARPRGRARSQHHQQRGQDQRRRDVGHRVCVCAGTFSRRRGMSVTVTVTAEPRWRRSVCGKSVSTRTITMIIYEYSRKGHEMRSRRTVVIASRTLCEIRFVSKLNSTVFTAAAYEIRKRLLQSAVRVIKGSSVLYSPSKEQRMVLQYIML